MSARLTLFLAFAGFTAAAVPAAESPEARAARVYAAGLEAPLLELRRGALLIQACADRLQPACSAQQREFAAKDRAIELLDALTLFPQRPADDPTQGVTQPRELAKKIDEISAAMLRASNEYDRRLFVRYGASLRACPDGDVTRFREALDELIRVEYSGFQALTGAELDQAKAALAREEASLADELRRAPPEDCAAQRNVGEYLMQLMYPKLQPWRAEDRRAVNGQPAFEFSSPPKKEEPALPKPELAQAVTGNFVTVVATELQLTVFPESAPRIKAIVDAVEKANAAQ